MFLSNWHKFLCSRHFRLKAKTLSAADGVFSQCHMEVWHARQQSHCLWADETVSAVRYWLSSPEHVGHQIIGWWSHLNQISNLPMRLKVGRLYLSFIVNFIESSITIQVVQSWRFECLNTASLRLTFHFSPNWFCRLTCRLENRSSSQVQEVAWSPLTELWLLRPQTARELTMSWPVQCLFYYLPIVWMLLWMCLHVFIDCLFISSCVFHCCLSPLYLQSVFTVLPPLVLTSSRQLSIILHSIKKTFCSILWWAQSLTMTSIFTVSQRLQWSLDIRKNKQNL